MNLRDLIDIPALALRLVTPDPIDRLPEVRWVAATELVDPTVFLDGGELVLTTGLALGHTDMGAYVRRLSEAGVAALGFAIGLGHDQVPEAIVDAAVACRLPVFAVPYETPFVAITREVAERIMAERMAAELRAVETHEHLARRLLAGDGLEGLTRALADVGGGPCAVVDVHGRVLAAVPPRVAWPVEQIIRHRTETAPWRLGGLRGVPIVIEGETVAMLCTRSTAGEPVLRSGATMLGLELARQTALLTGRRLLLGQVIEDMLHGIVTEQEAARRLERFGIDAGAGHSVIVGVVPDAEDRLQHATWAVQTLIARRADPIDTALVEGRLILIVRGGDDLRELARMTLLRLQRLSPAAAVGVGTVHSGVVGLRRSLTEALSAAGSGPGIHDAGALSLAGTLGLDRAGRAIAEAMFAPLVEADEASGSDLVGTLLTYLRHDGRPSSTAEALHLHRNGLAHRLRRIAELTGRDPRRLEDQVELVLAARVTGRL